MAVVYLARDLRHDRPVALKVLHPDLARTLGPERFQRGGASSRCTAPPSSRSIAYAKSRVWPEANIACDPE